ITKSAAPPSSPTASVSGRSRLALVGSDEIAVIVLYQRRYASKIADPPDDPLINSTPDRLPKVHGPGVFLLHQRRDALGPLPGQPPLDLGHQRPGDSLSAVIRMHSQPVDVPPPAVERPDDRADQPVFDFGNENVGGAFDDGSPQVIGGV